jgi:fructose-specific PTS system IIA-like component
MIEVPAAAFLIHDLACELDFFSIGSNDLLQGFVAVDRANPRLACLCNPLQPSFLRLLKRIVSDVHQAGKWVGLCGEMGAQLRCLPFLVGLGLDEISAAPSATAILKAELASWSLPVCVELLAEAVRCSTADEVERLVDERRLQRPVPLFDQDMILLDSESATKEEVIKELVDHLYVLGRTEQPRLVEHAVWQRENAYSTGFGHGFAIPHCRSKMITANSMVVLKLRKPVAWDSTDGQPVKFVLLLALHDSEHASPHMRILSQLARELVNEDFRLSLISECDPTRLYSYLNRLLKA